MPRLSFSMPIHMEWFSHTQVMWRDWLKSREEWHYKGWWTPLHHPFPQMSTYMPDVGNSPWSSSLLARLKGHWKWPFSLPLSADRLAQELLHNTAQLSGQLECRQERWWQCWQSQSMPHLLMSPSLWVQGSNSPGRIMRSEDYCSFSCVIPLSPSWPNSC